MKKTARAIFVGLSALFCLTADPPFVFPDVYKWVDEKGVIHFTEDEDAVPEKYREQVEKKSLPKEAIAPQEKIKTEKRGGKEPKAPARKEQAQKEKKGKFNRNRIESDVTDSLKNIVSLWKEGRYDALYEYGSQKSKTSVSQEEFGRRMAKKGQELAPSWETIRDISVDVESPTIAHATAKLGYKPKAGGETRTHTMTYRMVLEKGSWRIDLAKLLQSTGKSKHKK